MINLNRKVFGKITAKEIIGSYPPAKPETELSLVNELTLLLDDLKTKDAPEIRELIANQKENHIQINSRPGAMALAQDKIELFNEFSKQYLQELEQHLKNKS